MAIFYQQDFDALTTGQIAPGWSNQNGGNFVVSGSGTARGFGCATPVSLGIAMYGTPTTDANASIEFSQVISGNNSVGPVFRADASGENAYLLLPDVPNDSLTLFKRVGGGTNYAGLDTFPFALSDGDVLHLRVHPQGTNLRYKAWLNGAAEPSAWTRQPTDSTFQSGGYFGLINSGASGTPAKIDNIAIADSSATETAIGLGNILCTSNTATAVALELPVPSGGNGTFSYQWHRSASPAFTPAGGTAIAGATSRTLSQTGLSQGTRYFYKCVVTSGTQTANSFERPIRYTAPIAALSPRAVPGTLHLAAIGDSISVAAVWNGNKAPIEYVAEALSDYDEDAAITINNRAISGSDTAQWTAGGASMNAALASLEAASVVFVRLGMNDAQGGTNAATFNTRITSAVGALTGAGHTVVLSYPTYREPGNHAPTNASVNFDEATTALLLSYQAVLDSLINGTTVLAGDKASLDIIAARAPELLYDRIHPNALGSELMAQREVAAYLSSLPVADESVSLSESAIEAVAAAVLGKLKSDAGYVSLLAEAAAVAAGVAVPAAVRAELTPELALLNQNLDAKVSDVGQLFESLPGAQDVAASVSDAVRVELSPELLLVTQNLDAPISGIEEAPTPQAIVDAIKADGQWETLLASVSHAFNLTPPLTLPGVGIYTLKNAEGDATILTLRLTFNAQGFVTKREVL